MTPPTGLRRCTGLRDDSGQLTVVACIVMAITILTMAGYATVRTDIEAADPEREPPLGPEYENARQSFLATLEWLFTEGNLSVYDAFNESFSLVATAEARYGFSFSCHLDSVNETAPGEFTTVMQVSLHADYGHVSTTESLVLKK
jgi:hypothetical protein